VSEARSPTQPARWEVVNSTSGAMYFDCSRACVPVTTIGSPIDVFIDGVAETLKLGQPGDLASSDALGRLLILGLVTSAEGYFRDVLLGLTSVCPLAQEKIADQLIALGALEFYGAHDAARGVFEGVSFASETEVRKRTEQISGATWKKTDSLGVALSNFEKVCHMRHAAVHTKGVLNRGNAKALGLALAGGRQMHLSVDVPHLHQAARACTNVVRDYNTVVYRHTLRRWLDQKVLSGTWAKDKRRFTAAFDLFRCKTDSVAPPSAYAAYLSYLPSLTQRLSGP